MAAYTMKLFTQIDIDKNYLYVFICFLTIIKLPSYVLHFCSPKVESTTFGSQSDMRL
jgi:hypothetical protein